MTANQWLGVSTLQHDFVEIEGRLCCLIFSFIHLLNISMNIARSMCCCCNICPPNRFCARV